MRRSQRWTTKGSPLRCSRDFSGSRDMPATVQRRGETLRSARCLSPYLRLPAPDPYDSPIAAATGERSASPGGEAEGPVSAEAVAPLEQLAAAGPVVVETAAALLGDIEQSFGIPELEQLTRDGRIRINHWQESNQPALRRWAEQHGVELTEERLPSQG
jgi:hypothetical protein